MAWCNKKLEKWFNIYIENPFKTWWKVRKYFKRPKWECHFHLVKTYKGYPYATWNWLGKILDINIHDVWWKDKWNTPRHERNPLIYICLFRKFAFTAIPHIWYYDEFGEKHSRDMTYWEYVLDFLYYKKGKTLRCYPVCTGDFKSYHKRIYGNAEDGSEDTLEPYSYVVPVVAMSLNKKGIERLKKELNDENYSNI